MLVDVTSSPRTMQRPNGRSARIREQVHRAVVELLAAHAADELSIPMIAERSGVHQATIYRRWASVPALLEDVVSAGPARTSPLPDTGSLRGDLDAYATAVADALAGPAGVLLLSTAVSNLSPRESAGPSVVLGERTEQLKGMLGRAEARGEHPPTVDELLELVVAPLYFHALFGQPASGREARRLVERLLAMTAPDSSRQST